MRNICKNYILATAEEIQTRMKRLRESRHLPKNKAPNPEEVRACTPFLNRQIQIIGPRLIVTLGRHATSYILSKAGFPVEGITKLHGRTFTTRLLGLQLVVIPTFHPAAALYNVKYKRGLEDDFQIIKFELEKLGGL